jgi:hypothetical protein
MPTKKKRLAGRAVKKRAGGNRRRRHATGRHRPCTSAAIGPVYVHIGTDMVGYIPALESASE